MNRMQFQPPKNTSLKYKYPPNIPPDMHPKRKCGMDKQYFRNTANQLSYIWLKQNEEFWVFPTSFIAQYMRGYRWDGHNWIFVTINLNSIDACYS